MDSPRDSIRFVPFTDDSLADPYPQYAALRAADPVHWSEKLRAWILFRYDDVATVLRDDVHFSADRGRASRAALRAADPVHWSEKLRAWILFRYDDVATVLRDDVHFSADRGRASRAARTEQPAAANLRTVSSDPPACLEVRAILNTALVPRVRAMAPRIDAIIAELVAGLDGRTEVDLVADFAYPLPIRVIGDLLGIPEAERARFEALSRTIARGMDRFYGREDVAAGIREIGAYFLELVTARTDLGDDLVRGLLGAEHHGDRLAPLEVAAMCSALVFGGHETTANLVANGMLALLRHPAELARLRADPSLAAPAVEELIRYDTPPQFISRVVMAPWELGDKALRPGEAVLLGIGAANRDPAIFPEPDRVDLRRAPNPHIGFGVGTHFCPGAQLSRMEARAAIPALLARFPDLALAGEPVWRRTLILRGLERLPLRLGRGGLLGGAPTY